MTSGELLSAQVGLPKSFRIVVLLLVGIVLVQALNLSGTKLPAVLIVLHVWLFYVAMVLSGVRISISASPLRFAN